MLSKKKKIRLWINYINNENFEMFSYFSEFMSDNEIFDIKKNKRHNITSSQKFGI